MFSLEKCIPCKKPVINGATKLLNKGLELISYIISLLKIYKTKTGDYLSITSRYVPGTGLEPVRTNVHWILSPTCLPIPPPGRNILDYN